MKRAEQLTIYKRVSMLFFTIGSTAHGCSAVFHLCITTGTNLQRIWRLRTTVLRSSSPCPMKRKAEQPTLPTGHGQQLHSPCTAMADQAVQVKVHEEPTHVPPVTSNVTMLSMILMLIICHTRHAIRLPARAVHGDHAVTCGLAAQSVTAAAAAQSHPR